MTVGGNGCPATLVNRTLLRRQLGWTWGYLKTGIQASTVDDDERERVYSREEYYWGRSPSRLAKKMAEFIPSDAGGRRLVDLGAGEGRDAVFFARQGFDVDAVDVSPAGLQKAHRLAEEHGVEITTIEADINEFEPPEPVDVVFSSGAVQFIRPAVRPRQFGRFQDETIPGGLHAVFAFVDHPDIPPAPDTTDDQYPFGRNELQSYYRDWEPLYSEEVIFDDDSGGTPHQHAARIHIARSPDGE